MKSNIEYVLLLVNFNIRLKQVKSFCFNNKESMNFSEEIIFSLILLISESNILLSFIDNNKLGFFNIFLINLFLNF